MKVRVFTADVRSQQEVKELQGEVEATLMLRPNSTVQWLQSSAGARSPGDRGYTVTQLTAIVTSTEDRT